MKKNTLIYFIGACIVLVATIAGYGFWYSLIASESQQVRTIAGKIVEQNQSASRASHAKSELSNLATQQSTIDQYFVAPQDVVPFLEQIQSIGKFLGAKVDVVSVSAEPGTPFGQLMLSLNITGSFDSVSRTIGAVEYEPYDTVIKSLNLEQVQLPGDTATSTGHWSAAAVFAVGAQTGTSTTPTPSP